VFYSPEEELKHDITCLMIAAIFLNFLQSEQYFSPACSVSKLALISGADQWLSVTHHSQSDRQIRNRKSQS
jgi:hypothetical protein